MANIDPIFSKIADVQWYSASLAGVNITKDLTAGTIALIFTTDATNGGFVQKLRFRPAGTTGAATVCRIFLNNGSTTATAANNVMIDDITLPSITNSEVAAQTMQELYLNMALPAGYRLYATMGTNLTIGWFISCYGGKY